MCVKIIQLIKKWFCQKKQKTEIEVVIKRIPIINYPELMTYVNCMINNHKGRFLSINSEVIVTQSNGPNYLFVTIVFEVDKGEK